MQFCRSPLCFLLYSEPNNGSGAVELSQALWKEEGGSRGNMVGAVHGGFNQSRGMPSHAQADNVAVKNWRQGPEPYNSRAHRTRRQKGFTACTRTRMTRFDLGFGFNAAVFLVAFFSWLPTLTLEQFATLTDWKVPSEETA